MTVSSALSNISNLEFISINEFAIKNHFAKRVGLEYVIDTRRLRGKIETRNRVVSGHLLPYVVPNKDLDLVIVLRCSPRTLRKRYEARKYPERKIVENVEAEMIGVIAAACVQAYDPKKISEFDTTRTKPETIAQRSLDLIKGKEAPFFGSIDWLSTSTPSSFTSALQGKYNTFNIPKRITRFASPRARKSKY